MIENLTKILKDEFSFINTNPLDTIVLNAETTKDKSKIITLKGNVIGEKPVSVDSFLYKGDIRGIINFFSSLVFKPLFFDCWFIIWGQPTKRTQYFILSKDHAAFNAMFFHAQKILKAKEKALICLEMKHLEDEENKKQYQKTLDNF